ncbi:MAG: 16S rRNA (guanine(966)-N(2))-methyltransferase RsmD [Acidimicrobiia bacterium]
MSRSAGGGSGRGPRVIAGEAGGLRLTAPKGTRTRPTADRVKEALFAALGPGRLLGAVVLDCYAGSGALGIEALSRGAARALLVDRDPLAVDAIRRNLRTTGFGDRGSVQRRGVGSVVRGEPPPDAPFDLIFCDPPYDQPAGELAGVLVALVEPGWLSEGGTVVVERASSAGPPLLPSGWGVTWSRVYGDTLLVLAAPATEHE